MHRDALEAVRHTRRSARFDAANAVVNLLPITFLANLNKLLFWKKLMVFDNPIVRWLAARRKDNMYALAC